MGSIRLIVAALRRHTVVIRLLVAVGLLAVLVNRINAAGIVSAFGSARPGYLAAAVLFLVPNFALQLLKWRYLLRSAGVPADLGGIAASVFGGYFLGAATPARTGEFGRGVFLPGRPLATAAALTVIDKGYNQVVVVSAGLFALAFYLPDPWSLFAGISSVVPLVAVMAVHTIEPLIRRLAHRLTASDRPDFVLAVLDTISRKTIAGMLLYSLVFFVVYAFQFHLFLCAFTDVSAGVSLRTIPLVYIVDLALPISVGAFGVKEAAAVAILGRAGIPAAPVFAATLVQNAVTFLAPALAGGLITLLYRPGPGRQDRP